MLNNSNPFTNYRKCVILTRYEIVRLGLRTKKRNRFASPTVWLSLCEIFYEVKNYVERKEIAGY